MFKLDLVEDEIGRKLAESQPLLSELEQTIALRLEALRTTRPL
jgi:hypothetical protein